MLTGEYIKVLSLIGFMVYILILFIGLLFWLDSKGKDK